MPVPPGLKQQKTKKPIRNSFQEHWQIRALRLKHGGSDCHDLFIPPCVSHSLKRSYHLLYVVHFNQFFHEGNRLARKSLSSSLTLTDQLIREHFGQWRLLWLLPRPMSKLSFLLCSHPDLLCLKKGQPKQGHARHPVFSSGFFGTWWVLGTKEKQARKAHWLNRFQCNRDWDVELWLDSMQLVACLQRQEVATAWHIPAHHVSPSAQVRSRNLSSSWRNGISLVKKLEANLNKETQPTQGGGLDVQKDWFCQKAIFVILADVFQNLEWGFTLNHF